jgi:hypothetical protein
MMDQTGIKTYSELTLRDTLLGRFRYAVLGGTVGVATFSYDRPLNQAFYASREWKAIRDEVIIRDDGCDLGIPGFEIHDRLLVHHMNPMTPLDLTYFNEDILNPEYLICVSTRTHNAIHFGDEKQLPSNEVLERRPGDTTLW